MRRVISRFKDKAYCGTFRKDGRMVVAGGEEGVVRVFDTESRTLLRQLTGHKRPVHVTEFAADTSHVVSGGDDATVRLWDITTGQQTSRFDGHIDYVRALQVNPKSSEIWATGSYDHSCKLWDARMQKPSMNLKHDQPIESLAFFPSGSLLVTVGGTRLNVWDLYSGGRLLHTAIDHQKTITKVLMAQFSDSLGGGGGASRMLTASLDGHVKVFDVESFQVTHASKYPSPILSLGLSLDGRHLAVGMADGTLSIRRHTKQKAGARGNSNDVMDGKKTRGYQRKLTAASYKYFVRGQNAAAAQEDVLIAKQKEAALASFDRLLRKFRYREALDAAIATKRPEVVTTVVEELAARAGINAALSGRDSSTLVPLLDQLRRMVSDPRYAALAAAVGHRVLDQYGGVAGDDSDVAGSLRVLREIVAVELKLQEDLMKIKGMLEPLLATVVADQDMAL